MTALSIMIAALLMDNKKLSIINESKPNYNFMLTIENMKKLDQNKIKEFYNTVPNVWGTHDVWHEYSQKIISAYIRRQNFFHDSIVLNAGSAGNSYNIDCKSMYHVDIADQKIKNVKNAFVASIENLPFENEFFNNILCVGSVLNYCDALAAISELSRVLKLGGNLLLEYESSWGFEYLGKKDIYKKDACIITTEYIEKQHTQWLYSPTYITAILKSCNFTVKDKYTYHILDGLLSKYLDDKFAVNLTKADIILNKLPFWKDHGNNIIVCSTKI